MSAMDYSKENQNIRLNQDKEEFIRINSDAPKQRKDTHKENHNREYRNENAELNEFNKKVIGAKTRYYFSVFRVCDTKIKDYGQLLAFQKHMQREMKVENADIERSKDNEILIGSADIVGDLKKYLYGVKINCNSNLAIEVFMSGGNGFYSAMTQQEQKDWIQQNIKFLKDTFGDDCIYACLHMDETTPHIHGLVTCKYFNEKSQTFRLATSHYFDGIDKLRELQDKYGDCIHSRFNNMVRGIRGSRAKHISLKAWYAMQNQKMNEKNYDHVLAYAQKSYLTEKRLKELESTLIDMQENKDTEKLLKKINKLEKNNSTYKETIETLSKKYSIKQEDILDLVKIIENKDKKNQRQR